MMLSRSLLAATLALAFIPSLVSAQVAEKRVLTLEGAKLIGAAAELEARAQGSEVVIAVVDDGGHLLYLARMDGASIGLIEIAEAKASAAATFGVPTSADRDAGVPQGEPPEGGVPVVVQGQVIGAIGVSGADGRLNLRIARSGLEAIPSARR